jgi:hypothetical protein
VNKARMAARNIPNGILSAQHKRMAFLRCKPGEGIPDPLTHQHKRKGISA